MRVYHECIATLERELGVEPSGETVATRQTLLPRDDTGVLSHTQRRVGGRELVGRPDERRQLTRPWRDAKLLEDVLNAGLPCSMPLEDALAGYEVARHEASMPI